MRTTKDPTPPKAPLLRTQEVTWLPVPTGLRGMLGAQEGHLHLHSLHPVVLLGGGSHALIPHVDFTEGPAAIPLLAE